MLNFFLLNENQPRNKNWILLLFYHCRFHIRHGNAEVASSAEESDLDEEEDLIHSRSANFERDANLHGTSYAKWKREMLKEMGEEENDEYDDDINEVDEF